MTPSRSFQRIGAGEVSTSNAKVWNCASKATIVISGRQWRSLPLRSIGMVFSLCLPVKSCRMILQSSLPAVKTRGKTGSLKSSAPKQLCFQRFVEREGAEDYGKTGDK